MGCMKEPDCTVNTGASGGVAALQGGDWQGTGGLERFPAPAAAPQTHRPPGSITCRATETSTPTTPTPNSNSNMLAVIH